MKKLLALVLALVMTLGLATVSSNAANWSDLKDTDKVADARQEAFQVLNAINVFEGDENNNLNPDKQLTRAEAAKIIATLNLGKATAETLPINGQRFSDVATSNWAAGYINYCEDYGIIAGRGDGTFDPQGDLNVVSLAKMLLVSLGYNAETEKFVNYNDWEIAVTKLAVQVGLFEGFETQPNAHDKVTRADAAQMAFNTLKTPEVTYAQYANLGQYNNPLPSNAAQGTAIYKTTAARDTQTISTATINDGSARGTYMVEFAEEHFPKLTRNSHDIDVWGRPSTTWTLDRNLVGTYENLDKRVSVTEKSTSGAAVYKQLGGATLLTQYANDQTVVDPSFRIFVDGHELNASDKKADLDLYETIKKAIVGNSTATLGISGAGAQFELFLDDDSYIDYGVNNTIARKPVISVVVINTYLAEVLATYDEKNETLLVGAWTDKNAQETYKASADDVTKDMTAYKEGDFVLLQRTADDSTVRWVDDPEMVANSSINLYKTTNQTGGNGDVQQVGTTDGDKYDIAKMAFYDPAVLRNYNLTEMKDFTYDLFLDQYGNMIGIQYNKRDTSLVFVAGYEKDSTVLAAQTVKANLIFMDGTMATKAVALAPKGSAYTYFNGITATDNAVVNGANDRANGKNQTLNSWFTYSKDENGNITLRDIVAAANAAKYTNNAFKQYSVNKVNIGGDPAISSTRSTYDYYTAKGTKLTALADDNTVFISAVADNTVKHTFGVPATTYTGAVAKVNGVVTGVKNATISTVDVTKAVMEDQTTVNLNAFKERIGEGYATENGYTEYGEDNSNVFYVFDAKGYVVAAIALTDKLSADHLAFITSIVKQRELIGGVYFDTYKAITPEGGKEEVTIKVNSDRSNTTDNKLAKNTLYAIAYDKDNNVILANAVTSALDDVNTQMSRRFGYAEMLVGDKNAAGEIVTSITLGDVNNVRTTNMVYGYGAGNKQLGYIATAASGNFWTLKDGDYVWHPTASSAYNDAIATVDGRSFVVDGVYAICDKATGFSGTLVFIAKETTVAGLSDAVIAINKAGVGVYDGMRFYTEDGHTITYNEAREAVLKKIKTDLPLSNPTFVNVNTVEFTMNGKQVTSTILALNANATTINNATYQVYKVTFADDGTSVYLNRNEGNTVLEAALKAEGSTGYTAGDWLMVDIYDTATKTSELRFTTFGSINGITAGNPCDLVIAEAQTSDVTALQTLINKTAGTTIDVTDMTIADPTKSLTVPKGKTLLIGGTAWGTTLTVKELTVAGEIKEDGNGLANTINVAADATVTGKMTGPSTTLNVAGTLYFKNGAVGVLEGVVTERVELGCDLTVIKTLKADEIYLVGDDAQGSNLTAETITDTADGTNTKVYLGYSYSNNSAQKNSGAENMTLTVKANTTLAQTITVNGENATLAADGNTVKLTANVTVEEGSDVVLDSVTSTKVTLKAGANAVLEDKSNVTTLEIDGSNTSVTAKSGTTIQGESRGANAAPTEKVEIIEESGATVTKTGDIVKTGEAVTVSINTITPNHTSVYLRTSDTVTVAFDKVLNSTGVSVDGGENVVVSSQRITFNPTKDQTTSTATFTIKGVKPADSVLKSGEVAAERNWTVTFNAEEEDWDW